jgi:hypothetical protein
MNTMLARAAVVAASTAIAAVGLASPAAAQSWTYTFQGDEAVCPFPLVVSGSGVDRAPREFRDKDGNLVRFLSAGKGQELTFANAITGDTFSTPANGAVTRTNYYPDGSSTAVLTGHNVVLLYRSDMGGPSATLYIGQVVVTIDTDGRWTVVKESGRTVDLCAEVSSTR